jgi:hypothetical protein
MKGRRIPSARVREKLPLQQKREKEGSKYRDEPKKMMRKGKE